MRTFCVILATFASAALAGCGTLSPREGQLDDAYRQYAAGDNAAVVADMDAFLQENPHASRTDEAHYLRGLARFNMKQYEPAKADLLDAVSGTKDTELRGKAALALGDLSLQTGDTTLAETMCRDAVGSLEELARNGEAKKEAPLLAEAYYRLGCVLQHLGQRRAADQQFSHVTYYYPDTEAASHAARAINASAWTVQAGSLARLSAAQADTKRFASLGQQVQALPVLAGGKTRYVIQVGRFARYEDAAALLPQVRQIQSDAFVTTAR